MTKFSTLVIEPYVVVARHARNHITPNRMHEDGLPQKLGFRGALVLGAAIFGHMTRGIVSRFGQDWLNQSVTDAKFLKSVCDGDRLRIETIPIQGVRAFNVTAYNETMNGELCATLVTEFSGNPPPIDPMADLDPNEWEGKVTKERSWERIEIGRAYRTLSHILSQAENDQWINVLQDESQIYKKKPYSAFHPSQILLQAPLGACNQYRGDNAIHASSKVVIRDMLKVGDEVQLLTVPAAKWEKKGNQWVTLYCAVRRNGYICAELFHTQIFKLRGA